MMDFRQRREALSKIERELFAAREASETALKVAHPTPRPTEDDLLPSCRRCGGKGVTGFITVHRGVHGLCYKCDGTGRELRPAFKAKAARVAAFRELERLRELYRLTKAARDQVAALGSERDVADWDQRLADVVDQGKAAAVEAAK